MNAQPFVRMNQLNAPVQQPIWRYMELGKYISLLSQSALFFPIPRALGDEHEGRLSDLDLSERAVEFESKWQAFNALWSFELARIGVSCWHESEHESMAMWQLYMPRGAGIAIRSTVAAMERVLQKSDRDFLPTARVRYMDYQTERTGKEAIEVLSCKRNAFAHEREVRFFVELTQAEAEFIAFGTSIRAMADLAKMKISDGIEVASMKPPAPAPPPLQGVYVNVDLRDLIESVWVAPGAKEWMRDAVVVVTEQFGLSGDLVKSTTLDSPPPDVWARPPTR